MQEIERKFLVNNDFRAFVSEQIHIVQAYLSSHPHRNVRIRIQGNTGYITVKGKTGSSGISRYEWEKEIPVNEAKELLRLCEPGIIEKTRYMVKHGRHIFAVDEFHGANQGLMIAEIELGAEDEAFEKPAWLGKEISGDKRYYNAYLSKTPYANW